MLLLTVCFFSIYMADVIAGALWKAAFLSNVASVLLLILTSVCFTAVIITLERRESEHTVDEKSSETLE
jgi:hypothetical protein